MITPSLHNEFPEIDSSWTVFLDRDGVINVEKEADYIRNWGEFKFYDGAAEAIAGISEKVARLFIVTNQKGVGKRLMTKEDLDDIHNHLSHAVVQLGGRIDEIYYCPDLNDDSYFRKPNPGMGIKAKEDYPEIDFTRSIMVGNTMSDMQFGKTLGMFTVFIPSTKPMPALPHPLVDIVCQDLAELAKALQKS